MKARLLLLVAALVLIASPALAFFDDFESGMGNWSRWPEASETLQSSGSHPYSGSMSAMQIQADPWSYASFAEFGSTTGGLKATVWVWEDFNESGANSARPVTNMLALVGDNGAATPDWSADYIQLGVVAWFPLGSTGYGFRTAYNDQNGLGFGSAGVARKAGWTQLGIEVDAVDAGGQVRFFIDGAQVGTSQRSGAALKWVRIGNNSKTYENFWYDDVSVVPEPGGLAALLAGVSGLALFRRRK